MWQLWPFVRYAKVLVVILAAAATLVGPWLSPAITTISSIVPWSTIHRDAGAGVTSTFIEHFSQRFNEASGKFTGPPGLDNSTQLEPLLRNPHQTFNGIAHMIKQQAHHIQLATAHVDLGEDAFAHQLRQQLETWRKQMQTYARSYRQLQGTFSTMLYSQQRVLQEMQNLASTFVSNVEFALQLESCNRTDTRQQAACKRHTVGLLKDCRSAAVKARTKISKLETTAQEVVQQIDDLAAGLVNAEASMEQVSVTAYQQHATATREVDLAQQRSASAQRSADNASKTVGQLGVVTFALCVFAPPACALGLLGTGAGIVASAIADSEVGTAQRSLLRSDALKYAVHSVHQESQRAAQNTAVIHGVVVQQSAWVRDMLSGLDDIDMVLFEVIDLSGKLNVSERRVLLRQLHREFGRWLVTATALLEKSSSTELVVHVL